MGKQSQRAKKNNLVSKYPLTSFARRLVWPGEPNIGNNLPRHHIEMLLAHKVYKRTVRDAKNIHCIFILIGLI